MSEVTSAKALLAAGKNVQAAGLDQFRQAADNVSFDQIAMATGLSETDFADAVSFISGPAAVIYGHEFMRSTDAAALAAALEVAVAPAAVVVVPVVAVVPVAVVATPAPCPPEAQKFLNHVCSVVRSVSLVHVASHTPSGEVSNVVSVEKWQKQET